jgi:hypothetical protein
VVAATFSAHAQHVCASQIADQPPDSPLREGHVFGYLLDGAPGVHRDEEEDGAVTGHEVPVVVDGIAVNHRLIYRLSPESQFPYLNSRNTILPFFIRVKNV